MKRFYAIIVCFISLNISYQSFAASEDYPNDLGYRFATGHISLNSQIGGFISTTPRLLDYAVTQYSTKTDTRVSLPAFRTGNVEIVEDDYGIVPLGYVGLTGVIGLALPVNGNGKMCVNIKTGRTNGECTMSKPAVRGYIGFNEYFTKNLSVSRRKQVLLHEIGHMFGMAHPRRVCTFGTVMSVSDEFSLLEECRVGVPFLTPYDVETLNSWY